MGKGWTYALDAFAPGAGALARSSQDNTEEANNYGTQAPQQPYNQQPLGDPALQKDKYNPGYSQSRNPILDNKYAGKNSFGQESNPGALRGIRDQIAAQTSGKSYHTDAGYTEAPKGWDQTKAGVAEQYWNKNQGRLQGPSATQGAYDDTKDMYDAPGQGEQYWNQVSGKFNEGTNAQSAYERANNQSTNPGLGAYYDRAKTETANTMNDQLAAMGMFGSSVGAHKMGNAISALDAERANREADFAMRQNQLVGQLASSADSQNQNLLGMGGQMSNAAQQLGLGRAAQGMNAAGAVDQTDLSRFNAGMQGSMMAQDARRTRGQDAFNNIYAPSQAMAGMVGDAQADIIQGDRDYMDAAAAAEMGLLQDNLAYSQYQSDRMKDDERHGMNMAQNIIGMAAGGGGMGG